MENDLMLAPWDGALRWASLKTPPQIATLSVSPGFLLRGGRALAGGAVAWDDLGMESAAPFPLHGDEMTR